MARGRLITIEGVDGAGKTTLAAELVARLQEEGEPVVLLREPGGVDAAERIRALVTDPEVSLGGRAEALLYAAARAQLVEERLRPLLEAGTLVLLDRFVDSSLAYQGAGRGLGIEAIAEVNRFATGGLQPDRTLLLRVAPEVGRRRQTARAAPADRLEREAQAFFAAIACAYDSLAAAEPARYRVIDAEAPFDQVLAAALTAITDIRRTR